MRNTAAIALLALTAACAAPTQPAHTTTSATATHSAADTAYLTRVRATIPGATDADLITAGHHACDLRATMDQLATADALTKQGFDTDAAATITVAAERVYCPNM